jgi:hypothetical protein
MSTAISIGVLNELTSVIRNPERVSTVECSGTQPWVDYWRCSLGLEKILQLHEELPGDEPPLSGGIGVSVDIGIVG